MMPRPQMWQDMRELVRLYDAAVRTQPSTVVEVGSLFGGTLWWWMVGLPVAPKVVVSIDKRVPESDYRHVEQLHWWGQWQQWATLRKIDFHHLDADSGSEETVEAVKSIVPSIDFLFIDGAHDERSVRRDYEAYGSLVRSGGVIGFHDIAFTEGEYFGVKPLWEELRNRYPHEEVVMTPGEWGIGIIYKV